jgi:hypothetical protein
MDYKKFYEDISIHVEMMVTPEMRMHACADPVHHNLSFQIFRLLSGYGEALEELKKLRPANIQQPLQPDSGHTPVAS